MTSTPHAPYVHGYTLSSIAGTKSCDTVRYRKGKKAGLSSDWRLQRDGMKSEGLGIADEEGGVNTREGLVHSARHTTGGEWERSA